MILGVICRGNGPACWLQFNVHYQPTNCGLFGKGKNSIVEWLSAYEEPDRRWDVISFNFGHWDIGNDKATYQPNLETVIEELRQTGARLIWVTTCPVPNGCEPAGEFDIRGKTPGRRAGVMKKYLNPWAAEVMVRHGWIINFSNTRPNGPIRWPYGSQSAHDSEPHHASGQERLYGGRDQGRPVWHKPLPCTAVVATIKSQSGRS